MRFVGDLRHLLKGARFRQVFAVRVTSQCADGVFQVALASYVLFSPEQEPDARAIALGLAAILLPFSVLGPFVGVFLDRWSRRQVLVWSNLLRVVPVLVCAVIIAAGLPEWLLFAFVLLAFSINRFLLAALSAALPHVVVTDDLVLANAITPTSGTIAFMTGLAVATGLRPVVPGSQPAAVIVCGSALVYLAAAALAARIPRDLLGPDFDPAFPAVRQAARHVARGLVAGVRHLHERPTAGHALAVIAAHRFFYGLSTVTLILLYRNYFYAPTDTSASLEGLSIAVLVSGLGFFMAAVVTPVATARMVPQAWMLTLLVTAAVIEVFPGGMFTEPTVLVAAFVLGISAQGVKICVDTLVQAGIDDAFRGRVFALYDVIFNVVFVLAAAVGTLVVPTRGKSYLVVAIVAIGYLVTAAVYLSRLRLEAMTPTGEPSRG
ncbi:MAG: MFS transporter [Nocardioidaceae bacterium]